MVPLRPEAVLLAGVYGVGKSALAEEIAGILERRGIPYAAIDLDWLAWSNAGAPDHDDATLLARNLAAVAATYREAGAVRLVLAGSIPTAAWLDAIRAAVGVPLRVVRITAPRSTIEARLGAAPATGRRDDLRRALEALAAGRADGTGDEDAVIVNDGPLPGVAGAVLDALGWR